MRPYLVALICVCAVLGDLAAASAPGSHAWRLFKSKHGKNYNRGEEAMRFANFLATKQRVDRHNADPSSTYKMRVNHMADWTAEEYQRLNGFKIDEAQLDRAPLSQKLAEKLDGPLPDSVDWRKVPNRVSAVKDQKQCGSCWAFSTTGLLEGQEVGQNISKLIPLSEQELVDCSSTNLGCNGGFMQYALKDIAQDLGGIDSEADYSYEGQDDTCRINKTKFVMTTKGGRLLQQGDEKALLKAVANYGPVSVAIDATENFQSYDSGVFTDKTCDPKLVDHAVLVVGYGTDSKHGDYWIVKNSWGSAWGEKGYIRMKRGVNLCGIAQYPTLADF